MTRVVKFWHQILLVLSLVAVRRRSAATSMSAFCCYFFLGDAVSICFLSQVILLLFYMSLM